MNYTAVGIHDFYAFLLVFARVGGLMAAAPLFSNRAIPRQVKAGFILVFSLALVPLVAPQTGPIPDSLFLLMGGVLKEAWRRRACRSTGAPWSPKPPPQCW